MHIKSIILEGFKSYAQRTEINGFDPLFNAITGLNGSGKSNILDSICFLLGISNLSQVRAANLQDLVYKNGQAGITKATVSITFDNSNKSQSPLGFETHDEITVTRQVVIGGRNKYLINGVNANNTRVQDLFCSVGLNGRITKVLNMKPPEILNEEITPTMQKLKEERSSYLEYQKLMREIEHLSRLYVAWLFVCAEESKVKSAEDLKVMQDSITQLQANMADNEHKVQELSAQIQELQKKRDQEVGGVLKGLEETLSEVQRVDAKAQSAVDMKKQNLKDETKKRKELVKTMEEVSKASEKLSALQEEGQKDSAALEAAQCHFKAVSAGLSTNEDGEEATLAGQMMTCKNDMSKADTEAKQAQMKLKHAQQELKAKQTEVKKMDSGYQKDQEAFNTVKKNKEKLEADMGKLQYQDGKEESLLDRKRQLNREVTTLRNTYENLARNLMTVWSNAKRMVGERMEGGGRKTSISSALVGYEADLRKDMEESVFGSTLVCDNWNNASRGLDKRVMTQNCYSGGEGETSSILRGTLSGVLRVAKLQQSSFHKQQEELEMLRRTIEECEETLRSSKEVQKKAEEKYKMKNAEAEREKELKAAQQKLNSAKTKADAFSKKLKERQQYMIAMKSIQEQIDNMSTTVAQNKESVRKAQEELTRQKEVIVAQDKEIKGKSTEANHMREKTNESQLKIKELEHNISKHRKDSQDAAAKAGEVGKGGEKKGWRGTLSKKEPLTAGVQAGGGGEGGMEGGERVEEICPKGVNMESTLREGLSKGGRGEGGGGLPKNDHKMLSQLRGGEGGREEKGVWGKYLVNKRAMNF
ncbi:unnamed protein product [Coregonus sp. 'balchen']|nr:unnamed protein product [Coregonus sp. 'balchen']